MNWHDYFPKRPVRIFVVVVCLFLVVAGISIFSVRADPSYYPFKATFEKDRVNIADTDPRIASLQVVQILDITRSVVVRITYVLDLSRATMIAIQDDVQSELAELSYVESVERNGILCIPEATTACPPWPGFVIGELLVMFVDNPADPVAHPWPDDSTLAASNIGTTSLTLNWSNTKENSSIVSYRILNYYDPIATVSNTTHSYTVTGLTPGTVYSFLMEAVNDAGNLRLGPSTTITTSREKVPGPQPPITQPPATTSSPTMNPSPGLATTVTRTVNVTLSWLSGYLQLILVGLAVAVVTGLSVAVFKRRG